jgi:peptidoglycan glycosyltransferase
MNPHLRRIFYGFATCFVALIGVLSYWQVYAQESLANDPQNDLRIRRSLESPRGLILAGDGETVLAKSVKNSGNNGETIYKRAYPQGRLYSNITGYWSVRYGATGIESAENSTLSGTSDPATVQELINQASGGPRPGNNVVLTIDPELQKLAYEQLAQSKTGRGSAMAIDPETGEILALASQPSYDPNDIDDNFKRLQNDPDSPLLARATQGLYTPGSVFKVITAAAGLKSGLEPSRKFVDDGSYVANGYRVTNYKGRSYGKVDFTKALALSINAIFAKIAVEIVGAEPLAQMARSFGFGDDYGDFHLPITPSSLGGGPPSSWKDNYLASVGFGQGEVQTNVFEMGMVAASVANDGTMMQPRIIKEIRSPDGVIIDKKTPSQRRGILDEQTAKTSQKMMRKVVTDGGASGAKIAGTTVAGKTGTAEVSSGEPHSWFIAFAPVEDPEIAVAVLVENGEEGFKSALPIARRMMEEHLNKG